MATAHSTNPDTFYRDLIQRMLDADEKLVNIVRRELDRIQTKTDDAAVRLKLLAGRYGDG